MNESEASRGLVDELIARGKELLSAHDPEKVEFVGDPEVDRLLDPRGEYPHAFVMGCLVNRQVRARTAWQLPSAARERLAARGRGFSMSSLAKLTETDWVQCLTVNSDGEPSDLHRHPVEMARVLHSGIQRIADVYGSDARTIWSDRPSSATLVSRFLQFRGVGAKIASMTANILVRDFRIPVSDYRCIDISPDRHVLRVMGRMGLVDEDSSPALAIYRARDLNPEFPGVFDLIVWQIGSNFCHQTRPACPACPFAAQCRYARRERNQPHA